MIFQIKNTANITEAGQMSEVDDNEEDKEDYEHHLALSN